MDNLFWINSDGSPLIMLPQKNEIEWLGYKSEWYSIACSSNDFLTVLDINNTPVIVLGDEPLPTCLIIINGKLFIIRSYWMDDDTAIYDFIEKLSKNNLNFSIIEEVNLVYNESKWVVFDGAYTVEESVHCKLEVDVLIKFNKIITFSYEDNLSSFLVHSFI